VVHHGLTTKRIKRAPSSRILIPLVLGEIAGTTTAAFLLSPPVRHVVERIRVIDTPLEFGLLVAMIPLGGIHGATPPEWIQVAFAALVNAVIWFGLGRALVSLPRVMRSAPGPADP
jgi:hypothetical protein